MIPLSADATQDGIHERRGTTFPDGPGEADGIVHRGRRRHPIEVEQLEDAEPKDVDDLGIEAGQRPARMLRDDAVEGGLPAQCAGDDLADERPIALVLEPAARPGERVRQIGGLFAHRTEDLIRRSARGRDHPRSIFIPGTM